MSSILSIPPPSTRFSPPGMPRAKKSSDKTDLLGALGKHRDEKFGGGGTPRECTQATHAKVCSTDVSVTVMHLEASQRAVALDTHTSTFRWRLAGRFGSRRVTRHQTPQCIRSNVTFGDSCGPNSTYMRLSPQPAVLPLGFQWVCEWRLQLPRQPRPQTRELEKNDQACTWSRDMGIRDQGLGHGWTARWCEQPGWSWGGKEKEGGSRMPAGSSPLTLRKKVRLLPYSSSRPAPTLRVHRAVNRAQAAGSGAAAVQAPDSPGTYRRFLSEGSVAQTYPTLCDPTDSTPQAPLSMGCPRPECWRAASHGPLPIALARAECWQ
uniref:Uncharacterized protein n=1 Tax=Rangifer tarandus platyrhynchus TaxID=3082113 RepID=A0ACB0FE46_RANTA|nr:unnamed protein product [Rangifer tarandus platyrhynchus]